MKNVLVTFFYFLFLFNTWHKISINNTWHKISIKKNSQKFGVVFLLGPVNMIYSDSYSLLFSEYYVFCIFLSGWNIAQPC